MEFSGQITTSGAGACPPGPPAASCSVAAAWFSVTVVLAQQVRQVPGVRDVALDGGHHGGRAYRAPRRPRAAARRPGPGGRGRGEGQRAATARRSAAEAGSAARAGRAAARPGWPRPARAGTSAAAGRPPRPSGRSAPRPGSWPAGPTGNRVRPPVAERLGRHPPAAATASGQAGSRSISRWPMASTREDHGFGDRQRGPRVPGEVDQPGQQRDEERQAEAPARPGTSRAGSGRHSATTSSAGPPPPGARTRPAGRRRQRQAAGQRGQRASGSAQAAARRRGPRPCGVARAAGRGALATRAASGQAESPSRAGRRAAG